ncbi:MAG: GHKL domain-containing protein [Defluviitaleaceae bacterium]|nr:GHKL domain-containing protein [Defluviitaleaceae bacterium]
MNTINLIILENLSKLANSINIAGLANAISVSYTFSMILVGLSENRKFTRYLRLLAVCFVIYLSFLHFNLEGFINLPMALIATFVFKDEHDTYSITLFKSLSAMMVFTFFITAVGSLFFAFFPNAMTTIDFGFFMAWLSVAFGIAVYAVLIKKGVLQAFQRFFKHKGIVIKCVIGELVLLVLTSIILPLVLAANSVNYIFAIYYFLFSTSFFFTAYLAYQLMTAETKIIYEEQRQKFAEINGMIIEEKYNNIIGLKHYYSKLYEMFNGFILSQDWQGLKAHFEKYISPVHEEHIKNDFTPQQLDLVGLPLIKNLLLDTVIKAKYVYKTEIFIDIQSNVDCCYIQETDLFIILNEWLNNAFCAIENEGENKIKDGYIHILISCDIQGNALTVKVTNPIFEDIDINAVHDLGYTTKKEHSGAGLNAVKNIILAYENAEYMTYIELGKFVQFLILREKK